MGDRYWQLNSRVEDKISGQAGRVCTVTNDHGRESLTVQYDDGSWCEQPVECWKYVGPPPSPTDLPDAVVELTDAEIDDLGQELDNPNKVYRLDRIVAAVESIVAARLAAASGPWAEQLDTAKRDGQIEVARAFQAWAATNEIAENIDWKWFGEICRRYSDIYETGDDSE